MARLINYGPGEIADRLTILQLKLLHGAAAGRDVKHFLDERNALLAQLRSRELLGAWFEHFLELQAVNSSLWQKEDELRGMRGERERPGGITIGAAEAAALCAFRIQELNDRRNELITLINVNTGDHRGEEKL